MRFLRFSPDKADCGSQARQSTQEKSSRHDSDDALALAVAIHGAGMAGVASFALNMLKPLHWMGGQAVWILQPFISAFGAGPGRRTGALPGGLSSDGVARLLEREDGLDELAFHLERLQHEGEHANRDGDGDGNGSGA